MNKINLTYIEEWKGEPEEVDAIGLDRAYIPCGEHGCTCHFHVPYILMALVGKAKFLIDRFEDARSAMSQARSFREHYGAEWKWKIMASHGFMMILDIEEGCHKCKVERGKFHREDVMSIEGPPYYED